MPTSLSQEENRKSIRSATMRFVRDNEERLADIQYQSDIEMVGLESASLHPYGCVFGEGIGSFALTKWGWAGRESGVILTPGEALLQYDLLKGTGSESSGADFLESRRSFASDSMRNRFPNDRFRLDHPTTVVTGCGGHNISGFEDYYIIGFPLVEFVGHPYGLGSSRWQGSEEGVFADILKLTEMGWSAMISPYSEYHENAFKVALSRRIKYNYSEAGEIDRYTWEIDLSCLKDEQFYISETMRVVGTLEGDHLFVHHPLLGHELYSALSYGPSTHFPLWNSMASPVRDVPALKLHLTEVGLMDLSPVSDGGRDEHLSGDYFC